MRSIENEIKPVGQLEVWRLDLADYQSILSSSHQVSELSRLDGFIGNAGLETQSIQFAEGLELQLCVNVVSTMLSAISVLPKLRETSRRFKAPTHVTFQGSGYHIFGPDQELDVPGNADIFESLSRGSINIMGRYALSKLMMQQCAHEFADRVTDVIVNTTHLGWAGTELGRSKESIPWGQKVGFALIGWSAEKGSRPCVYAVTAGKETHGCYLSEGRVCPESQFMRSARGQRIQKRVWNDLVSRMREISPGITANIAPN